MFSSLKSQISRRRKVILAVLGAGLVWLYFPPLGVVVEMPELEPFFEPGVSHGRPVFIQTENHIYYCVRLNRPVWPWFSGDYFKKLERQGMQYRLVTTSAFRPFQLQRRRGWKMAFVHEKTVEPYTIEYWKSIDYKSGSFPVKVRWPWVYLRLGKVEGPITSVVLPESDTVKISANVPRYPSSILRRATRQRHFLILEFVASATREQLIDHYVENFGGDMESRLIPEDPRVWIKPSGETGSSLMFPETLQVDAQQDLYADDPLIVHCAERARALPPEAHPQQPGTLVNLPSASLYLLRIRYRSEDEAQKALKTLTTSAERPN
jgi:hypothetical protein